MLGIPNLLVSSIIPRPSTFLFSYITVFYRSMLPCDEFRGSSALPNFW